MAAIGVEDSAIWRRITATALAVAIAFASTTIASEDKPNKIERAAKKAGQAAETPPIGPESGREDGHPGGQFVERTADKTDKSIRRALE